MASASQALQLILNGVKRVADLNHVVVHLAAGEDHPGEEEVMIVPDQDQEDQEIDQDQDHLAIEVILLYF